MMVGCASQWRERCRVCQWWPVGSQPRGACSSRAIVQMLDGSVTWPVRRSGGQGESRGGTLWRRGAGALLGALYSEVGVEADKQEGSRPGSRAD